jgi:hypothetical protein
VHAPLCVSAIMCVASHRAKARARVCAVDSSLGFVLPCRHFAAHCVQQRLHRVCVCVCVCDAHVHTNTAAPPYMAASACLKKTAISVRMQSTHDTVLLAYTIRSIHFFRAQAL